MLQKWFKSKFRKDSTERPEAPDYAECKRILLEGSSAKRTELATCTNVPPEILYFLSSDKDPKVRCAVARNPETPIQADVILSKDKEVIVRLALSEKVAQLLPDLRPEQNEKITEMAFAILETLAVDQEKQVRLALANSVRNLGTIPKSIAMTLAGDEEDEVALPILEFSPLLDDEDLIGLIVGGLRKARLGALARRAELSGSLSEAIAETRDLVAISSLLKNEKADISERAFDILLDGAENAPKWLDIMAVRDAVPESTLFKLARLASGALLEKLRARSGLGNALKLEIDKAIDEDRAKEAETPEALDGEKAIEAQVEKMHLDGTLTPQAVMAAVSKKDLEFAMIAMAKIVGVPAVEVRKVFTTESAKSVVTLAWRCGLSVKDAVVLQRDVGKIPPNKIMGKDSGDEFPMSEDELLWQSDLIFSA